MSQISEITKNDQAVDVADRSLISELEIQRQVIHLADLISKDYEDRSLLAVAVLKGAFIFAADLVRRLIRIGVNVDIDFIRASSYGDDVKSSGEIRIHNDFSVDVMGRDVLIIDDIIDSGLTLQFIYNHLLNRQAKSVRTCVLLDKISRRTADFSPDYSGFQIPDYFLVGYGLDFAQKHRCLPFITHLSNEVKK